MLSPRKHFPLLLALALASVARSPLSAQRAVRPAPPELTVLEDASAFSARARRIDFEILPPGMPVGGQLVPAGAAFRLAGGLLPAVGIDGEAPRSGRSKTLNNLFAHGAFPERDPLAGDAGPECGLRIHFARPVSRVGFSIRSLTDERLNANVTVLRRGRLVGRGFFDAGSSFRFVGFQARFAFDEVRLDFVNPTRSAFSLDDLLHELDLSDRDRDGIPAFADLCPTIPSAGAGDEDGDGIGDPCDPFPLDPENDFDGDGIGADVDNSPLVPNPRQTDLDGDGVGDASDEQMLGSDADGDGVTDDADNCPNAFNPEQADCDGDDVGDVCDPVLVDPASVDVTLARGQRLTLTKRICLPPVPRRMDVVIAIDLTGSMGGEIALVRQNIALFIQNLRGGTSSDLRFGLVSLRDYPGIFSSCGYNRLYGNAGDSPFRVEAPIGSSDAQVVLALAGLTAANGGDGPESYTRALWELGQPDSGVGFRPGAARFVLLVCDDVPHDCSIGLGLGTCTGRLSTGQDPGRDRTLFTPDDLDFQFDALTALATTDTTLFTVYSSPTGFCGWDRWSQFTDAGVAVQINSDGSLPPGTDIEGLVLDALTDPIVNQVQLVPIQPCGLDISFDPPLLNGPFDVSAGASLTIDETIHVPLDLPVGEVTCRVLVLADGALVGVQTVHVVVPCETLDLEGPVNGQAVAPSTFAAQGVTITTAGSHSGAAIFDSTPGGPNAGSSDKDLLVGLGNVLILQQNPHQTVPGIFDFPNDSAGGGSITIDFLSPSVLFSIDLIDVDAISPTQTVNVTLTDEGGNDRRYVVPGGWTTDVFAQGPPGFGTLDLTSLAPQAGHASTATASEDAGFDADHVVRLVVQLSGSGALDNLSFCAGP